MKDSTLIRIKVPKALYESALRQALLEAKEPIGGPKGRKYSKEDDYDKPAKKVNPAKKYKDAEPKRGVGAHKGKAFVKDDAYTEKVSKKKSLKEDEFGSAYPHPHENTGGSRNATLYPNRKPELDANRLAEKKKIQERKRRAEKKHNDAAEDKKLIKKLVKPGALRGSK